MKYPRSYAPVVLRLGLVFVLAWFGMSQVLSPESWVSFIPEWATSMTGVSAVTLVLVNGIGELVLAALLAFGIRVRIVASLVFIHLLTIVFEVGLSPVGVRDLGLALGALAVALNGRDELSFDRPQNEQL